MNWFRRKMKRAGKPVSLGEPDTSRIPLREFAYLDETSVQSLLASLIGTLPAEVTSMTERSFEAEGSANAHLAIPVVTKSELSARFKGSHTSGSQVLSRAVAETLFKDFYERTCARFVWRSSRPTGDGGPFSLHRGDLIEVDVELTPDPIYRFNTTMGIMSDIAEDYPALSEDATAALVLNEVGPVTKVLDRLLVGLIPLKADALGLRAGVIGGQMMLAPAEFFDATHAPSMPVKVVGVTEQDNYWRDVRRVLFSKTRFTILGRVNRSGVHPSWVPVKLAEGMRDIAPQFPDTITRAGNVSHGTAVNVRQEANRKAMEEALVLFAARLAGDASTDREPDVRAFAHAKRAAGDSLALQGEAFDDLVNWLVDEQMVPSRPSDTRSARIAARDQAGLRSSTAPTGLADFASTRDDGPVPAEALVDVEIIAIYW